MENFFYNENFFSDLSELVDHLDIDENSISELPEDWSITCEETTLEKVFVIPKQFAVNAIVGLTENWDDRLPGESESLHKQIEIAISDAIDIDKLNNGLPSLYYPNGKKFKITKSDLL